MKFTDGFWFLRSGIILQRATQVQSFELTRVVGHEKV